MTLQETNSIIALCVAGTVCVVSLCFAWVQWRLWVLDSRIRTNREEELTRRWLTYYNCLPFGADLAAPQEDEPPASEKKQ